MTDRVIGERRPATRELTIFNFDITVEGKKAWCDIWGCGLGIGPIDKVLPTAELVARLGREYREAIAVDHLIVMD